MKIKLFTTVSTLILLTFWNNASGQDHVHYLADPAQTPREHQLDVSHMLVDLKFDAAAGKVMGKVTHTFTALRSKVDSVFWDAPGIDIKSVVLEGKTPTNVKYRISNEGVTTYFSPALTWDAVQRMSITYEAQPKRGIYFIGWNVPNVTDPKNQTRKQIWTQGQGIDNRHWIPMYDNMNDKYITETITTFDAAYKVLSNGNLISEKINKNGTKTWHYALNKPHAGYLLMLAIGEFGVKKSTTSNGTPVQFWYYPEHEANVQYTSMKTEDIIVFLEQETGTPYPWGAYSQVMVQDFLYGAMENTSATVFGDFFNVDEYSVNDRSYVNVNAHELTHQWFGDLVTARSGVGTWLQESFATYYAKCYMGHLYGNDEYRWNMYGEMQSVLQAAKNDDYPVGHTKAGRARVYPKGSTVLHMLRYVVGDEEFKRGIKLYLDRHKFGLVETNDLNQAFQDACGLSLDWFFDQWIARGGEPHYKVSYQNYTNQTVVNVEQIQEQNLTIGLFKMPIDLEINYTDGSKLLHRVWISKQSERVQVDHAPGKEVDFIIFDVQDQVLKQVTYNRTTADLLAQLAKAEFMIDRMEALVALANVDIELKRAALHAAFEKEDFHAMKSEIVKQLLKDTKSTLFLMTKLPGDDVRVKRTLLMNNENVGTYKRIYESALSDKSYINIEKALEKLMEDGGENMDAYFERTASILGQNHNVRITWLSYKILQLRKDSADLMYDKTSIYYDYLNELTAYSSELYEFRTRINAMQTIKKFNYLSGPSIQYLLQACTSTNGRLVAPAKEIIFWYNEQFEFKKVIQQVFDQTKFTDEERKKLRDLGVVN